MIHVKKGIVIYYSYSGNTRKIAEMIKELKDFDLCEIEPIKPYTNDYQKLVDQEKQKIKNHESVDLKELNVDFSQYEKIIIGAPVWWYTYPSVIRGFLNKYDLKELNVDIFVTNGGWLGHTIEDFKQYMHVNSYIDIKFNGNDLSTPKDRIKKWISKL